MIDALQINPFTGDRPQVDDLYRVVMVTRTINEQNKPKVTLTLQKVRINWMYEDIEDIHEPE